MARSLRLMCVLAHPDDESLGTGGILARYAAEGVETYLLTATSGELGWFGHPREHPGAEELGRLRRDELMAAAQVLGLQQVNLLGYCDGVLDQADPFEVTTAIASHLRRIRPQVVVTFGPDGAYGHPDHIAISQLTLAATLAAANGSRSDLPGAPHQVAKLYYLAATRQSWQIYQSAFGDIAITVDGIDRHAHYWPEWAISARIDTAAYWKQVWQAVRCHRTQLPNLRALEQLTEQEHRQLWGTQLFYRAFSHVNGGRALENNLFAGIAPVGEPSPH